MRKMPKQSGTFMKGGLRFTKVRSKVLEAVPNVRWWFIATSASSTRQVVATTSLLFSKENVVAVTDSEVIVLPMKGPGVFGTGVASDTSDRAPLDTVQCSFEPKSARIVIDGRELKIFGGHGYEALQVAAACGAVMPDWFIAG